MPWSKLRQQPSTPEILGAFLANYWQFGWVILLNTHKAVVLYIFVMAYRKVIVQFIEYMTYISVDKLANFNIKYTLIKAWICHSRSAYEKHKQNRQSLEYLTKAMCFK